MPKLSGAQQRAPRPRSPPAGIVSRSAPVRPKPERGRETERAGFEPAMEFDPHTRLSRRGCCRVLRFARFACLAASQMSFAAAICRPLLLFTASRTASSGLAGRPTRKRRRRARRLLLLRAGEAAGRDSQGARSPPHHRQCPARFRTPRSSTLRSGDLALRCMRRNSGPWTLPVTSATWRTLGRTSSSCRTSQTR